MHEDSLVEGMKELMPVYCVIGENSSLQRGRMSWR